jgi:hypothetical protein
MKRLCVFFLLMVLISCSSRKDSDALLFEESVKIHEEALAIADTVENGIKQQVYAYPDSAAMLLHELDLWRSDLVEIPGYEHDHSHSHQHDHAPLNITAQEMLTIQKELRQRILQIRQRSERITQAE